LLLRLIDLTSCRYREIRFRGSVIEDGGLRRLPQEEVFEQVSGVFHLPLTLSAAFYVCHPSLPVFRVPFAASSLDPVFSSLPTPLYPVVCCIVFHLLHRTQSPHYSAHVSLLPAHANPHNFHHGMPLAFRRPAPVCAWP